MLLPLNPLLASRISAVPLLCSASAEFRNGLVETDFVEVFDVLLELDEELDADDDEDAELDVLFGVGAGVVAVKKLFPAPKPILGA